MFKVTKVLLRQLIINFITTHCKALGCQVVTYIIFSSKAGRVPFFLVGLFLATTRADQLENRCVQPVILS